MTCNKRLKKEKDFNLVFKKGKRIFSDSMTLISFPADELKVGFVVSKKHGNSVKRNRIKRLMRESFRSFTPLIRQNFFFVIMPKIKEEYSLKKFSSDLKYMLIKGGFINNAQID